MSNSFYNKILASLAHNNSVTMMRFTLYEITWKNVLCADLIWNYFKFGVCTVQPTKSNYYYYYYSRGKMEQLSIETETAQNFVQNRA
jgi:hypothetical protein